ncbi:MAG: hypothetical protein ACRDQT_12565 [Gaiellaceae bacterium]
MAVTGRRRPFRTRASAVLAAALAALAVCPAVAAHSDGGALGFRSTVTGITPRVEGVVARVLDADDRLDLTNETGKPLVVLGYEGERYLAFRDGRVYRNARSPAAYLNDDRFGDVAIPSSADPDAEPVWEVVSERERYDWHDHRIHWMSRELPPKVEATKDQAQHVFDWKVPATLGGDPLVISGSLDYEPPPGGRPTALLAVLGAVVVGGAAALLPRLRRERRAPPT